MSRSELDLMALEQRSRNNRSAAVIGVLRAWRVRERASGLLRWQVIALEKAKTEKDSRTRSTSAIR